MPTQGLHVVITGDPKGFQRALAQAGGSLSAFGAKQKSVSAKIGKAGSVMSKGITLPIVAAAGASVKLAADFEAQMSSLASVTDAPTAKLEELRKAALKAGADTKYSAQEAAVAQTELAKGGVSTANILKGALAGALGLAAAGELDLGEAAATTANALNLFGLGGDKATHVADALATAANATTADVSDFGMALKAGGGVAKSAGLSFDQTVVALEALAASGVKNSDAGTSLKTALIQLLKPSDKSAALMKKLNLTFVDGQGKMKSLGDISTMLRDKLGGMTKAQRTAALAQIAGTDGVRTLLSLYDAGPAKLDAYAKGVAKQGTAADVAAKKQDNFKGKLEQLRGSVETLGIIIGSTLLPPLTELAKKATDVANKVATAFSSMPPGMQQTVLMVAGAAAAFGPLLIIISKVVAAGQALVGAFSGIAAAVGVSIGPFLLIVGAIAAVGVGLVLLYKRSAAFRGAVQGAIAAIAPAFQNLVNTLKPLIGQLGAALGPLADALGPVLAFAVKLAVPIIKTALGAITQALKGFVQIATGIVKLLTGILRGDFGQMWAGIKTIFSGALNAIIGLVKLQLLTGMGRIGGLAVKGLAVAVRGGLALVKGAFAVIFKAPVALGNVAVAAMRSVGGLIVRGLGAALRGGLGLIKSAAGAVIGAGLAAIRAYLGAYKTVGVLLIKGAIAAIRGGIGLARSAAGAVARAAVSAIKALAGAAKGAGLAVIRGALGALRQGASGAASAGADLVRGLINGIKALAGQAIKAAENLVGDAINAAKKKLHIGSPSRVTHEMGEQVAQGLANGVAAGTASVRSATRAMGDGVLFELDAKIADATDALAKLQAAFDATDKQAQINAAQSKVNRLGGLQHVGARRRTSGKGLKRSERNANLDYNRAQEKHSKHNDAVRAARKDLHDLTVEAQRANAAADIQLKIDGLERLKDFNAAIGDIKSSMHDLVDTAASNFRQMRETAIDADLGKSLAALDDSYAGELVRKRQGIAADPRVAELKGLRDAAAKSERDAQDAELAQQKAQADSKRAAADKRVQDAEAALAHVQGSGSARLVAQAQSRLDVARAGQQSAIASQASVDADLKKLADSRRADELESELENARTEAQDRADALKDGLDTEEANFKTSLQTRLDEEAAALEARKQSYAQFAADVGAILAPLGLVFTGSADQEGAINAPEPHKPNVPAPKKRPRKPPKHHRRAAGGQVADFAELTRLNELGPETLVLPRGTRVTPASRSDDASSGPAIGTVNVYPSGAAGNDPQALAAWLGFQFGTRRR